MSKFDNVIKENVDIGSDEPVKPGREGLKACPFCGSKDITVDNLGGTDRQVRCRGCGACSRIDTLNPAVDSWNKRV